MTRQSLLTSVASIDATVSALLGTRARLQASLDDMDPEGVRKEDPKWFKNARRHLSDFGKAHLRDLHSQGLTVPQAAAAMHISRSRVRFWWEDWKLALPAGKGTAAGSGAKH